MNIEYKICATLDEFNTLFNSGEIQDSWIVLIEDQPALWTNGKLLPCPYTKEQLESLFVTIASKGIANGIASLNENGKIPESQLPSYVDDVIEFDNLAAFPTVGESGKIYVAIDTSLTYRWSGSTYVEISPSIALGETESTAYAGDKGKILEIFKSKLDSAGTSCISHYAYFPEHVNLWTVNYKEDALSHSSLTLDGATTANAGVMTATDKAELDSLSNLSDSLPSFLIKGYKVLKGSNDRILLQPEVYLRQGDGTYADVTTDQAPVHIMAATTTDGGAMKASDRVFIDSLNGKIYSEGGDLYLLYGSNNNDNGSATIFMKASGNVIGDTSVANVINGNGNTIRGTMNMVHGSANTLYGGMGFVSGDGNDLSNVYGTALGEGLLINTTHCTTVGSFNTVSTRTDGDLHVLAVGIGLDDDNRKTAFSVMLNGNIFFGDDTEDKANKFYDATTKKISENFLPDSVPTSTGFTNMQVVSALPENPDANTLYIVTA